jgi:Ca2+-binding RTX toxin-like protein
VFASADFGFSDPDSNHLLAVKLDTLPSLGTLTDNGVAVTPGQVVSVADITGGKLIYHAPAISTAAHVDLTFQVQDDGGTANGGIDLDPTPNDLHFDVAALQVTVSPPPTGTGTQTTSTGQNLATTSTSTKITGGAGDDTLTGGATGDYLHGADGDDVINGGSAFDDINGMVGNDTAHGNAGDDWVVGGKGNDVLFGDAGGDIVWGNIGNDTLDGGDGADQVRGGQGDDSLSGGAGNDFVSGDLGNDTETGGAGADTFHGGQNIGIDRVLDFNQAEGDHVLLDPGTTYTVSQVGADTVIDMGAGSEMILVGVQLSTLHTGWIG